MSRRSFKKHTTYSGRVVYDRKTHRLTFKDGLRIINNVKLGYSSLMDELVFGRDLLIFFVNFLGRIRAYYFSNPDDLAELTTNFFTLFDFVYLLSAEVGSGLLESFLNNVRRRIPRSE
jgi:hypothetical protein